MLTYQDLLKVGENEKDRIDFVKNAISRHMSSELYKTAVTAYEYDARRNTTILRYQKTLTTLTGQIVPDLYSPNHKTISNFFDRFVIQQNQFLLGNGVTWKKTDTKKRLGKQFDGKLQTGGKDALIGGISFGFWNLDHLEVFKVTEFAPLWDEENGSLRAGIRWWQIDTQKPLRATLYEEDGYTEYIWDKDSKNGEILHDKRPYIINVTISEIDGTQIMDGENYPEFPIVPFWGNPQRQSELVGLQEGIDAYDLIKNGFINELDNAQLYWIIKGAGGMDDSDLSQFLTRLKYTHAAAPLDGQEIDAQTVEIPHEAREKILDRIEKDLYKDYMALDLREIASGAATATQIRAAYEPMNTKADQYEYCVIDFIQGILSLAGIEDEPSFTRSMLVNVSEEITTVSQAASYLSDDYVTRKILTILGDGDQADEIIKQRTADELERGMVTDQNMGPDQNEEDGE
jgi:hypothetical protein